MEEFSKDRTDKFQLIGLLKGIVKTNNISIKAYAEVGKNDDDYKQGYYKGFRDIAENQNKLIENALQGMEV
jgi:hypothetical protein